MMMMFMHINTDRLQAARPGGQVGPTSDVCILMLPCVSVC